MRGSALESGNPKISNASQNRKYLFIYRKEIFHHKQSNLRGNDITASKLKMLKELLQISVLRKLASFTVTFLIEIFLIYLFVS